MNNQRQIAKIKAYGMVPIKARHPGHCPCGREACTFEPGDQIVKFRGAWWITHCVDRVKQTEFKANARFVLIEGKAHEKAWTDDPVKAAEWSRNLVEDERVVDRALP